MKTLRACPRLSTLWSPAALCPSQGIGGGQKMTRYIQGSDRSQVTLLPECLDDFVAQDNLVRVVDAVIGELDMVAMGVEGATPALTGRPSYHPSGLLKAGACSR